MFAWFLVVILFAVSVYFGWQAFKFAKIIMVFEDNLTTAIKSFEQAEASLDGILNLQMFFDSKDIQGIVVEAKNQIRAAKIDINTTASHFVMASRHKYILLEEEEQELYGNIENTVLPAELRQQQQIESMLAKHSQGNAQPLLTYPEQEGIHVGRTKHNR